MAQVLRVFIDAVPHVPDHRRLPLLSHLIHITTPSHSLYLAIGLMIKKATIHHGVDHLPMVSGWALLINCVGGGVYLNVVLHVHKSFKFNSNLCVKLLNTSPVHVHCINYESNLDNVIIM